jgi:outer membrane biosynthesis protein TonB
MRGNSKLKCALACVAIAAVLAAGYVSVGYAAPAGGASSAGPTDTEPPADTTPAPDPAPPAPKPAPKPASKPSPKPAPKPAHVYHAPVQNSAPTPAAQPTYTPPVHVTTKVVHHARAQTRRHKRVLHVVTTPKVQAHVKQASVVKINGVPTAAATTNASDAIRRSLVIAGIGLAALLFLLVLAVPATAARFTPPGRVLMDHQTDLVLVGVAILLVTALLFGITANG